MPVPLIAAAATIVGSAIISNQASKKAGRIDPYTADLQTQQTLALIEQRESLAEQRRLQDLILPSQLESSGYKVTRDDAGRITGVERDPEVAEIETELRGRTLKALRGELEVSPTVSRELKQSEESLRERLGRQLGPGYETSTPGIESLARERQRGFEITEAARRGELTLSEQLSSARTGQAQSGLSNILQARAAGVQTGGTIGQYLNYGGAVANASRYNTAINAAGQASQGLGSLAGTFTSMYSRPGTTSPGTLGAAFGYNPNANYSGQPLGQPDFSAGYY